MPRADEVVLIDVQFHLEVVHTPHGAQLLRNFTHRVCGAKGDWTMAAFRAQAIADTPPPPPAHTTH